MKNYLTSKCITSNVELMPRLSSKQEIESYMQSNEWKQFIYEDKLFENWAAMENALGLEPSLSATNVKNKYSKILSQYFSWERFNKTHKILITSVYDEPLAKELKGKYSECARGILVEALKNVSNEESIRVELILTYDELFAILGMAKVDYKATVYPDKNSLSKDAIELLNYLDVNKLNMKLNQTAYLGMKSIADNIRRSLGTINELIWRSTYKIMYSDSNIFTLATLDEEAALVSCIIKTLDKGNIPISNNTELLKDKCTQFKEQVIKYYNADYASMYNIPKIKLFYKVQHIYSTKEMLDRYSKKVNKDSINDTVLTALLKSLDKKFAKSWQFDGGVAEYIELLITKMSPVGKTKHHHEIDKNIMNTKVSTKKYFQFTKEELM